MKVNEGEVPQYYVEHSHPAIVRPEEWERVQLELARRKNSPRRTQSNSPFAGKLICGDCGEIYGAKVWHSTSKYRRTVWQCNGKFKGDEKCHTPHLYEENLKKHFLSALSELLSDRTALLEDGRLILQELLDFEKLDAECDGILQEQEVLSGLVKKLVDENAAQAISQETYIDRYNSLVDRYESLQARYVTLQKRKEQRQIQAAAISTCLDALAEADLLRISFSETLWNTVIDHVVAYADERLVFHFKNGARQEVNI